MKYKELEQFKKDTIEGLSIPSYMNLEFRVKVKGYTFGQRRPDDTVYMDKSRACLKVDHKDLSYSECSQFSRRSVSFKNVSQLQEKIDDLIVEVEALAKRNQAKKEGDKNEKKRVKEFIQESGFEEVSVYVDRNKVEFKNSKGIYKGIYSIDENGELSVKVLSQEFTPPLHHFLLID